MFISYTNTAIELSPIYFLLCLFPALVDEGDKTGQKSGTSALSTQRTLLLVVLWSTVCDIMVFTKTFSQISVNKGFISICLLHFQTWHKYFMNHVNKCLWITDDTSIANVSCEHVWKTFKQDLSTVTDAPFDHHQHLNTNNAHFKTLHFSTSLISICPWFNFHQLVYELRNVLPWTFH